MVSLTTYGVIEMNFKRKYHIVLGESEIISLVPTLIEQTRDTNNDGEINHLLKSIKRTHNSVEEKNPRIEFSGVNVCKRVSRILQSKGHKCEVIR